MKGSGLKHQLVILFIGLLALSLASMPGQVAADDGDIEVLERKAESQFPEGIRFTVKARSSHEIDDIRVFFKKLGNTRLSAYRPVEFEPGLEVTGVSLLSSGGLGSYFPPGTKIEYSFEIRDKSGAVHRTENQEFVYLDNRFEWLTVTSGLITVYYYSEYVENRAEIVLEAASEALERMLPVLGIAPEEPLRIVTYNNYTHMSEALPFRSQATTDKLITEGMAFSEERVLLVLGSNATVKGTVSHEFTHLLVGEASGRANREVPSWLNEGLAEYGNVDPTDGYEAALRYGIFSQRIKPLWYLTSFGGTPEDIIIAYGHARSVVFHMIDTYGGIVSGFAANPGSRRSADAGLRVRPIWLGHRMAGNSGHGGASTPVQLGGLSGGQANRHSGTHGDFRADFRANPSANKHRSAAHRSRGTAFPRTDKRSNSGGLS